MEPENDVNCEDNGVEHTKEYIRAMKAIERLRRKLLGY